jgi:hypothetical protein
VGGVRLGLGLAAFVRDAGEDAAAIVVADVATDVAVVLEPLNESRERALAQMDLLGQLLDAAMTLRGVGEPAKDLVFGEGEAMFALETLLERLADAGVLRLQLVPLI